MSEKIEKHSVVTIDYKLFDVEGNLLDSSDETGELSYIHGIGNIVPGLESELVGKVVGDSVKATVTPDKGYGELNDTLVQDIPKDQFEEADKLEIGMVFQVDAETGPIMVRVIGIGDKAVQVDGNHPMAGQTLKFEVVVKKVRVATEEELTHGHAHGEGGCGH